ncbi:hypothetical protein P4V33_26745 [Brevibacillus borstelensis]|uniref:hypothetical protein n=1 Tax=Brevibacillus borstelensis TaxID=45462 RepID=UPI002E24C6AB|nr:hypothetical protein [Brevibacillus borstelensis]
MIIIPEILLNLSKKRTIFRSQEDFQNSLMEELKQQGVKCLKNQNLMGSLIDILVEDGSTGRSYAIEIKHKTRKLSIVDKGEHFYLKSHVAQDQGRFDYIKDVQKLEELVRKFPNMSGCAILLTNDSAYWKKPLKKETADADFRIHEGKVVEGRLCWKEGTSLGTMSGREEGINLSGTYQMKWQDYSKVSEERYGEFRYLLVAIE